ncbi:E3 ubiquitin-protein ligase [Marasmius tenuissimus]|uniref:E3 ubiquitin-protein ligase n=1 Tax=Marasmius tenuissimus TaxID=585030 RepID=A0ABR3A7J4_9AGAR
MSPTATPEPLASSNNDLAALRSEARRVKELRLAERQARIMTRSKEQHAKDKKYDKFMEERLKCAVCWDILVQPRMLACGHHFCSDCILKQRKTRLGLQQVLPDGKIIYLPEGRSVDDLKKVIKCPQCQTDIIFRPSRAHRVAALAARLRDYQGLEAAEPELPFDWPWPHHKLIELITNKNGH